MAGDREPRVDVKIFISGTSTPFKGCREQLRSDLSALGHEVSVQEDFQTGTGLLLTRIQDYVAACDRVIVLVGDRYGAEASGSGIPKHQPSRSYTQWEYFFAVGERLEGRTAEPRALQIYIASETFLNGHAGHESDELRARQQQFIGVVTQSNRHRKPFDSVDQLCRWALRDLAQADTVVTSQVLVDQPRVFISYRVEDVGAAATMPARELERELTHGTVFLDRLSLNGGEPWPARLRDEVCSADVVLVLIGSRWLTLQGADGVRRLDEPDDWVRLEIETALGTQRTVIPVLVDGATPVNKRAFRTAPTVAALADLQAIELSTKQWRATFDPLVARLEEFGFQRTAADPPAT